MIDKKKIVKPLLVLAGVFIFVGITSYFHKQNSITLDEYAKSNPEALLPAHPTDTDLSAEADKPDTRSEDDTSDGNAGNENIPSANLTNPGVSENRITYVIADDTFADAFYYEPLSEELKEYITGSSYPSEDKGNLGISYEELRYVHVLHYNFEGMTTDGELICNVNIAADLLDIFYELYRNEYQIEKIRLIDEYNGDDTASMEDNNTSCFNYRVVDGTKSLSKHALGLALDINPLYNPYVTYPDGVLCISPKGSEAYADRDGAFPYKIDETDLCYKLFTEHGFTWGGNWNSLKDYQHFQKTP